MRSGAAASGSSFGVDAVGTLKLQAAPQGLLKACGQRGAHVALGVPRHVQAVDLAHDVAPETAVGGAGHVASVLSPARARARARFDLLRLELRIADDADERAVKTHASTSFRFAGPTGSPRLPR